MAANDSEGLRCGVIETKEKYYLNWKEGKCAIVTSYRPAPGDIKVEQFERETVFGTRPSEAARRTAPEDRYQTAAELAADLQRFLDDRPVAARRASWLRRT